MAKEVTVQLTLEWTFNRKKWSDEECHIKMLEEDPKLTFDYDIINSIFVLNDLDYPSIKDCKVITHE